MRHVPGPWGRFDDLVTGTARLFGPGLVERELVALYPEDVPQVLDTVERLAAAGKWAFGFVAYEAAPGLDPGLAVREPVEGLPLAWFGITGAPQEVPVVGQEADRPRRGPASRPGAWRPEWEEAAPPHDPASPPGAWRPEWQEAAPPHGPASPPGAWRPEWDEREHARAVRTVRDHIAAGDTYQCNLTTRLTGPIQGTAEGWYRDLAPAQRGAHNALLDIGRFALASASPELFFDCHGSDLTMRPMKGTAARGRTTAEDERAVALLRSSAKERAENVMIVDLVRNDLSRVAVPGTVRVPRLLHAERYETVHQLTSDVTARLRPGVGLTDVFRALFPCGSVTGAPKARTMRIITEVEDSPRGVYCGAIGVVSPPAFAGAPCSARFSVAIRTLVLDRERGTATYGTGGGITWGSEAPAEYRELLAKARVLEARPPDFELVETLRHRAGSGPRSLDRHLARAADSAAYFGFAFDGTTVRDTVAKSLDGVTDDARVRVRLFRDGQVAVEVDVLPPTDAEDRRPVRLALDPEPVDSRKCWPCHSTSLREPYTARLARHPDADEVLLINERGELTGGCTGNLAVRLDGTWWTPPLGDGCLPGIERGRLVESGRLRERTLRPADLLRAQGAPALAVVSSLRGWRAAEFRPA
ncbi:aminodeoxychorismate synthase component I [Streptomyces sp. NPDC048290]|uniref:aminodeoxychorismate synthase component I n=1 Tax=Streptomyces sp. NPDC048290 TaxID=3155811 RepID=UPI0034353649